MTKKQIIIGAVIVIVLAAFACACLDKQPTEPEEIEIGAVLPLTGDFAIYGEKMQNGIDLAVQEINEKGGINSKNLVVIYEDDQGDPKTSVAAFRKIIAVENVSVVIGGAISSTALPTAPIADKESVVLFSPAATSPKLTGISKYFFRNWPSDTYEGTIMGEFTADELKLHNVAVLYVNNDWGVGISQVFEKTFREKGGTIVAEEAFDPGASDFRTQLTKIKESDPQAIYIIGYLKELLILLKQKEELGIETQILSSSGFYDPQILQEVGEAAEGTIFTVPTYDPESPNEVEKAYVSTYEAKYGVTPDIWSAQAYDAMNIIAYALRNGATSGPEIQVELLKIKGFEGVTGLTSFDEKGEVQKPLRFLMVKNGEFITYQK
ncbi:branched-chain amino acid transport system substrate-binding protein [Methanophagales archaeon]|nr:branched-chain amino acid transport system substrate-binding protein [Methanophagales archaeon]